MKRRTMTAAAVALGLMLTTVVTTGSLKRASPAVPRQADRCPQRLQTFDTLDFQVFSHQVWNRLSESHADNIIVTWPDGHETNGITRHIADLSAMFVYAPNITIAVHPIRICQGDYTAVTGVMTGTFSRPMPTANGGAIPPTGKAFRITMATIGHWSGDTMDHEWLFWDNQDFMRQIGLSQ
jgi:predicted ester cyclase